ncbi:MAG: glutathione S-transferase family protein [Candidatus Lambdaproteobacteria bacterium]|nr:glutathione S-transferase family protein [Candidatus Lambdaproteobacteria bacterium]
MRTLYMGYISPYSRKVRVMLAEKGLECTLNESPADERLESPWAERISPCGRVPVLDDNGRVLFESNAILDYLLTQYPDTPRNAPKPPLARTLVRPEQRWDDTQTLIAIETMLDSGLNLLQLDRTGVRPAQSTYLGREQRRIQRILDWLEPRATPEGFVPGVFSVLDLNFIISVQWSDFRSMGFEWQKRPTLAKLVAFHAKRPSIATTGPEIHP